MTRQTFRAQAEAYGVRVDMTIAVTSDATEQELARALQIATAAAHAKHAEAVSSG